MNPPSKASHPAHSAARNSEKPSVDRRIARTRGLLQHALISLILQKDYETITVEDICAAANVGRSTFYAHYTGKDDLKRRGLEEHLRTLLSAHTMPATDDSQDRRFGFSLTLLQHARKHLGLYRALIRSRGGAIGLNAIRRIVADLVRDELHAPSGGKSKQDSAREVAVQYLVGAYMSVLTWWLDGGAKLPAEQVDALFRRLANSGVAQELS